MELWVIDKSRAARFCGLAALSIGAIVIVGWALRNPGLVQIRPGLVAMVFNTALCIAVAGMALALPPRWPRLQAIVQRFVGTFLVALSAVVLIENLFDVNAGIDLPALHVWVADLNPRPGRMAPNTAIGFLLIGMAFTLPHARAGWRAPLAMAAFVIGITGIVGYSLKVDFLYNWQGATRMALHTAVGISLLGLGLWLAVRAQTTRIARRNDGRDIFTAVAFSLAVVSTVASIGAFAILQNRVERTTTENLVRQHRDRSELLVSVIKERTTRAETITARPMAVTQLRVLLATPLDRSAPELLRQVAESYLPHGFNWIAFFQDGRLITAAGSPRTAPLLDVRLGGPGTRELLWDNGYYLRNRLEIRDATRAIGEVVTEQPLEILSTVAAADHQWGQSGEMLLCELGADPFQCFPARFHDKPFSVPRASEYRPVPMALAQRGAPSGAVTSFDYRGRRVLASYGAVGDLNLGIVLKMDWAELFAPVREQLQIMLIALVLLTLGSLWVVRLRLRPLVRELVQSRRQAQANEARFLAAAEATPDTFCILESVRDARGEIGDFVIRYLNDTAAQLVELPRDALQGKRLCEVLPRARTEGYLDKYRSVVETGEPLIEELHVAWPGPGNTWLNLQVVPLGDGVAVTARDVTERKVVEEKLMRMAHHDALTGLPNRVLLLDRLDQAVARARRNARPMALLYLDIDHFKHVNDTAGHAAGDNLLRGFAEQLRAALRPSDTVARLAGDEFVVILEDLRSTDAAETMAKKIMTVLDAPMRCSEEDISISVSIGIALYQGDTHTEHTAESLLEQADKAMYEAKRRGRARYWIYGALDGMGPLSRDSDGTVAALTAVPARARRDDDPASGR